MNLSVEDIRQMLHAHQVTAILRAGIELGVFDHLASGRADAPSIAALIGADGRGTRILLEALAAIGILEGAEGAYRLTPAADTHLVRGRPAYLGDLTRLIASDQMWDRLKRLSEAVRRGGTVMDNHAETPDHPFWVDFATYTAATAAPAAERLAGILAPWALALQPLEVLDVACGSGLYGFALARQYAHAYVWSLDWPNTLAVARGQAGRLGVLDRVQFIEGNMFETSLGGPYDLILASHVFHHFSEERSIELLRRLAHALKPTGRIAIHDVVPEGTPAVEDPFPRLFSVLMLVWTREGEAHPLSRYQRMLATSGFAPPAVHESSGFASKWLIADRGAACVEDQHKRPLVRY